MGSVVQKRKVIWDLGGSRNGIKLPCLDTCGLCAKRLIPFGLNGCILTSLKDIESGPWISLVILLGP